MICNFLISSEAPSYSRAILISLLSFPVCFYLSCLTRITILIRVKLNKPDKMTMDYLIGTELFFIENLLEIQNITRNFFIFTNFISKCSKVTFGIEEQAGDAF